MSDAPPFPMAGARYQRDKTGIRQIVVPYHVDNGDWASLDHWAPSEIPLGLPLTQRAANQELNGDWTLSLTFEGAPNDGKDLEETYELDIASAEDPIETFQDFPALRKKYKGELDEHKRVVWPETITDGSNKKGRNPLFGFESFLNPGSIWRVTRALKSFDRAALRDLGRISNPRVGQSGQRPPDEDNGRNWLKRSLKATWRGNVWQFSEEWLLSAPGGWVPDVYSPSAGRGGGLQTGGLQTGSL